MLLQLPLIDQVCQHGLSDRVGIAQHQRGIALQGFNHRGGRHDIAAAERRAQHLGQRADVEHMALGAVTGQRQVRAATEMVFVVVVLFDNAEVMQRGQRQQVLPACSVQAHGGGELVMRREVNHAHLVLTA